MTVAIAGSARSLLAPVGRPLRRAVVGARTRGWGDHSHLFVAFDASGWVLEYEARHLERTATTLGIRLGPSEWTGSVTRQSVFHLSQFRLLLDDFERHGNRLGVSYFHGRPGTPGMPEFDQCFATLRRRHEDLDRVQVTNRAMEELVLETGLAPAKVHRIPIGIDLAAFPLRATEAVARTRRTLDLPSTAFVVGSFQKDGVGWGDGLEPKLIKGPDVLLAMLERLREPVPELFVLLTGPARGYVRAGLERLRIPYRHALLPDIDSLAQAYDAIDLCVVTSRDEGGPRAVLESMATGVPVVSTRVGQGADLVRNGENGWLVDAAAHAAGASAEELERVRRAGRETAERNSYDALRPRWRELFEGFVEVPQPRA
jgi:glycosyltransferase involved in cell wall biosynthesis